MWSHEKAGNQLWPDAQHKMQSLKVRANGQDTSTSLAFILTSILLFSHYWDGVS